MKIIVSIITSNLVANLLSFHFCPALETKNKKLVVWKREIFLFFAALCFKLIPNSIDFHNRFSYMLLLFLI